MKVRRTQAQHCRCGTRLAADHAGLLCSACERQPGSTFMAAPSVPPDFWLTPKMRAALTSRHMGNVILAYRLHSWHGRAIPQTTIAAWAGLGQASVSRLETGPVPQDLRRLTDWAQVLRIPARLLWFDMPPTVGSRAVSGDDGGGTRTEEVSPTRRRDALALTGLALTAPVIDGLERELDMTNLTLDRGTTSEERTAQLELTAEDLGVQVVVADSRESLAPALRSLRSVRALLEERQPTRQQVRLVRVSAMLSTVVGQILFHAASFGKAREWYLTAAHAAEDAGDRYLMDIALAGQAYVPTYTDDPGGVLDLVGPRLAQDPKASPATAWLWAFAARAHAAQGDRVGFQRSVACAHECMERSSAQQVRPGVFARQPANLLFYEATGAVALGLHGAAISAADRAFARIPSGDSDRVLVRLEKASALAGSGEIPEACRVAIDALRQPGFYHDVGVRTYAVKFDRVIRGIQAPHTKEWRQVLADTYGSRRA
jgi:hypothetical protein